MNDRNYEEDIARYLDLAEKKKSEAKGCIVFAFLYAAIGIASWVCLAYSNDAALWIWAICGPIFTGLWGWLSVGRFRIRKGWMRYVEMLREEEAKEKMRENPE